MSVRVAYWLIIASIISASVLLRQADPGFIARLRLLGFDTLQQASPRQLNDTFQVRIIDIDERSLDEVGSWPWRRDQLADLVGKLFDLGAKVVVFDIVFPDAESNPLYGIPEEIRSSPEYKAIQEKLTIIGTADDKFAAAIRRRPVVLGIIGRSQSSARLPPARASFATVGDKVASFAPGFAGATANLPLFEDAATGIGALNWFPEHDQILRRVPTVVRIADQLYPSLISESLRLYFGVKTIEVRSAGDGGYAGNRGITTVRIGKTVIPTDRDGQLWLSFSRHNSARFISAADVIQARTASGSLDGRVAIIGTSASGLLDLRATPLDPVISGVEINAQAIEQLLEQRLLVRPDFAKGLEIVITVISALVLAWLVYRSGAAIAAIVGFATVSLFLVGSWIAFSRHGILLDAVYPLITSSAAYIFGTGFLYYHAESERNRSRQALMYIAREMEAAAQIQRSFLPNDNLAGPLREKFDIFAMMKPAKDVGGDFYDYFMIKRNKLAFAVGDVSGKGVPAALFMSVSRTVLRTLALEDESAGDVLSKVNAILSRDNSEGMFVTIFYAVLDLDTGVVEFSSAGHDDAFLLQSDNPAEPLNYMGPAIGLFDGANYPTQKRRLANGEAMLLLTDGVTEAFSADGRVFGPDRLAWVLGRTSRSDAKMIVESVTQHVARFSTGAEQSDDITCIAVQFRG